MKHLSRLFLLLVSLAAAGCLMIDPRALLAPPLTEVVVEDDPGWFISDKVLLVDVSGVISEEIGGGLFGGGLACSPAYLKTVLRRAEEDPAIRAVVLRIDSPGGTVSASEQMAREIRSFRDRAGVPVYAHIQGLGCSGAYYLAAACDEIRIQPAGITGSIGVIAILPRYRKLAEKIGYEEQVFKSGALKDLGSGMREMTDEEKAVFQGVIDESYDSFLEWILAHRTKPADRDALKKLADGRIYTARQAKDSGLVDGVNHLDETIASAKLAADVTRADIVTYSYSADPEANIYSPAGSARGPRLLDAELPGPLRPHRAGLYYLWQPGT